MKNNRTPGDDELVIEAINAGGEILLKSVSKLFNKCLQEGSVPNDWNNAVVVLLQKNGDIPKVGNYRLLHIYETLNEKVSP